MPLYLENPADTFTRWNGEPIGGVVYPRSIEQHWDGAELNAIGLHSPAAADAVPEGKVVTATSVARVEGVVKFVHTLADPPTLTLAQRREVLIPRLKAKRYDVETAGVTVTIGGDDVLVSTNRGDDRTALHMEFSRLGAGIRPDGATFNFADTVPRAVSNTDMMAAIQAALSFVQAAFDREGVVTALIQNANTHALMDAAEAAIETGWPASV